MSGDPTQTTKPTSKDLHAFPEGVTINLQPIPGRDQRVMTPEELIIAIGKEAKRRALMVGQDRKLKDELS